MHKQSHDLLRPRGNAAAATHESAARTTLATTAGEKFAVPDSYVTSAPSPGQRDRDPMMDHLGSPVRGGAEDITRKRSLIRPERRRQDDADPNYYYRQHAQNMDVMPSTTGNDPQLEEDFATMSSQSDPLKPSDLDSPPRNEKRSKTDAMTRAASKTGHNKLIRKGTRDDEHREKEVRRQKIKEASGTPSLWGTYCHMITFWAPNVALRCFGMKKKEQQRAWREKMGLISIILLICTFVGFLTFGFTQVVCPGGGPTRLQVNKVGPGYMIYHGKAYDLTRSRHPLARGIAAGGNVLWDMDESHAGQDGSFLFQNVNGKCKGLITPAQNSDVPTDSDGNLAWYFPCNTFNQDGSSSPNTSVGYYLGYGCHTSKNARENFYDLQSSGEVYFTWEDINNSSRNLMVYSGDVLDLDLLEWFNKTQVAWPSLFDDMRTNPAIRGIDTTLAFSSAANKQVAQCLQEIVKVGSIDTETVGCIASKVVLYVSLIFILSIVAAKFLLALVFQWFLSKKFAAKKTSMTGNKKKRNQQIEDWTDDIYRAPPKVTDPVSTVSDRSTKRSSFLPTTSRFTSPYAMEKSMAKGRPQPTTMASHSSTARLIPMAQVPSVSYEDSDRSEHTGMTHGDGRSGSGYDRSSLMPSGTPRFSVMPSDTEGSGSGPQGFIHDAVVPQPPPEWQPFGYPLAHTICLVTAYSEGPEGLRTTLDSIAMTDYPNSHKLIYIVCDGIIKGKGETMSTPDACLSMMKDHAIHPDDVEAFSYVAVASGSKRHNMAKIYSGFYDYGRNSIIPLERQQRVPVLLVAKCGTPEEEGTSKPGNRGKRDSQIILMSFLQKVMFDERMTELEYEMFNGIWKITGISPDFYEIVLMVDADTKVFPDSMTHMVSAMVQDPEIMGLCGETKIANKTQSWVTMIQVFEYFISHHQSKSFESVFGGVTCLPGCFCMYRIKTPKGGQNYWVPILANPDIVEHYSENVVDTLHKKNLLLLGEDRYLSTLMLKTFPKRKQVFVPQAVCKTTVPDSFKVLLSQRRRWINSTVHNLMELVLVRDLCGTFCFSMQFVVFIELVGTLVLPAAISFTIYVIVLALKAAIEHTPAPTIPLILLILILGLPGLLIVITAHRPIYIFWMLVYLLSLPIWNFILPVYAYWHFDDFSWGDTRKAQGEIKGGGKAGHAVEGVFDSSKITMKRWGDFEAERRVRGSVGWGNGGGGRSDGYGSGAGGYSQGHERKGSGLRYEEGLKYFMRACAGGFVEASSGPIDLSIDDANALGAVIKYFYTGEYPISRSFEGVDPYLRPSEPELLEDPMHVLSAYILTDKYNVESLTRLTAVLCLRLAKRSKYSVAFST
ncbi:Chitin synthase D [Cryoendolithus antarcticus]|uniref:chitin synthase n=1 Tax=Cryoendolithus antarcticus TaxID=1507870 RepID=A0A1V8SF56_9PEZI|nr:Chitin synthase D [Cryoendolithus antarcticus]